MSIAVFEEDLKEPRLIQIASGIPEHFNLTLNFALSHASNQVATVATIEEIVPLSDVEKRDVEESRLEISQGKAKRFTNVEEALKWLNE